MVDEVRRLTRAQLIQFLRNDHQAIRTFERMQDTAFDTAGLNDDLTTFTTTVDARVNEAVAAANRLSQAIEALLLQVAPQPIALPDDLAPPEVPLTAGQLTAALGSALSANPTATVGPTATNGTLNTYIRSDGAPAINLTATYPWTGQHSFSFAGNMATPTVLMSSTQPTIVWEETDQAADEKRWGILPSAKVLQFRSSTDSGGSSIIWGAVTRGVGTAIANIAWGDATNNNTYTFGSSGTATFTGQVTASRFVPVGGTAPTNGLYLPAANTVGLSANSTPVLQSTSTAMTVATSLKSTSATGGLGYGAGAGGAVTQATSRTTGVTLNKVCGAITLVSAAGSPTFAAFTVTNSAVAATDVIHVCQKSGTDKYLTHVTAVAAGSFEVSFATTGGTTVEQPVFNFAVIPAVTS